jgi:hypothetical protein
MAGEAQHDRAAVRGRAKVKTAAAVLAATAFGIAAGADAADRLPIQPGYYVSADTPCQKASNAILTLFDGVSFGNAHAECRKPSTRKLPDGSYQLTGQCRDMQVDGTRWQKTTENYAVVSPTEVIETNAFGKFQYRYCKQSDLPDPWNAVDLKSTNKQPGR